MKNKITILGAGLVGAPMAIDLARDHDVTVVDINRENLDNLEAVKTVEADLSHASKVAEVVRSADLVVNAVPGAIGFATLKNIIQQGKNTVDIAFYPEDMFLLDDLARANGVTAICDMGVAPGMSHLLVGYASAQMDILESIKIYVGGLPKERTPPFEYKAVFSPSDVIEEYTRPARLVRKGKIVDLEALSEIEAIEFDKVGSLEAFNSDGLRSLIKTVEAPEMVEKTLRYPGHVGKIKVLRDTGLFGKKPITVGNQEVVPLELTQRLLFPLWKFEEGEADFTVMRVVVKGIQDGQNTTYRWDLYDEYDPATRTHSMARTTGYAATMAARMVLSGLYDFKGISPPEYVGRDHNCVNFMLNGLRERNVLYEFNVSRSSASIGTGDAWWAD
jgi:saccharopine dehydrogenase-like NADP-dependent oxidoreductase